MMRLTPEEQKLQRQMKQAWRRKLGLCVRCATPTNGLVNCARCLDKDRARMKRRIDAFRSEGLCGVCGSPSIGWRCAPCQQRATEYMQHRVTEAFVPKLRTAGRARGKAA